jgi:hypothetical protein
MHVLQHAGAEVPEAYLWTAARSDRYPIEVPRLSEDELLQSRPAEASRDIRARVKRARAAQAERFAKQVPLPSRERPREGEIEVGEAGISDVDQTPQIMQQFARFRSSSAAGAVPPMLSAKRYCALRNTARSTAMPKWGRRSYGLTWSHPIK